MREIMRLAFLELRMIAHHRLFWTIFIPASVLLPFLNSFDLSHTQEGEWSYFLHLQLLLLGLILPVLVSFTINEESERFIPNLVLTKIEQRRAFFMGRSMAYLFIIIGVMLASHFVYLLVSIILWEKAAWDVFLAGEIAFLSAIGFYTVLTILATVTLLSVFYTLPVLTVYLGINITLFRDSSFALWWGPDQVLSYLETQGSLFWSGRLLYILLTPIVIWLIALRNERRCTG
ncbi:hypothetical protein [Aneurinibacillus migulanus]|uniref:ABC-2 family transporter protein n=1 Tax=Aneurinibacillus migulanus TaxID=47500 RepID=A0A0D1YCE4_ANEMI|nr:hypothetical protein [Aneurinibacillus migulanus]KIV56742.1 hypothetical protein TS65_11645 [Aneurinibacillus migulanus]KON97527.1 hypothetical protein AF333_20720 [Aneurinibacillus migulanus]MED0894049.1 hypothetical protein [Aneurinibacillus migulanus]MED1619223.1 hypothetical protein [Aneurinibacillus migulanus]SDK37152.1 hypothetical protein SAMN04487909_15120 [Aneurinibacillus migulanus]